MGFTFDDRNAQFGVCAPIAEMVRIKHQNEANNNCIFPYLGGEDVNSKPTIEYDRYIIDFDDLSFDDVSRQYPEAIDIVRQFGKGKRNTHSTAEWWKFERRRPELYRSIKNIEYVFGLCRVSPHLSVRRIKNECVYADSMDVFASDKFAFFSVVQSRVHEIWARFLSSSMKDDLRYAPSDCFETFPFPANYEHDGILEAIGQRYHDHRAELMVALSEGLTKTYNRFHKASDKSDEIERLRTLHDEMDRAVLRAYGWDDLAERARPEFLSEDTEADFTYQGRYFWPAALRDEVLARLLALNAERADAEKKATA
jgi:hypothetical protein